MRRNVFVLVALMTGAALFLPPVLDAQGRKASRAKCSNNLRQVGMAMLQYGDDKRFYPHVKSIRDLDEGIESNSNAVKLRALIFYGYHDNPEGFVCPSSDDYSPKIRDSDVLDNMRSWHWSRATNPNTRTAPWLDSASDPKGSESREFSYGLTRRGLNRNVRSTAVISADRAVRDGVTTGALAGNHDAGWNVVKADCSVEWVKYSPDSAKTLISTERGGGFLAIKDQTDASKFKPLSEDPPAAAEFRGWYKAEDGTVLKVGPTEWSRRSKTWGLRGSVLIGKENHSLVGRATAGALSGRVDGPAEVLPFKAKFAGRKLLIEIGGRTHAMVRTEAPPPPLDRKTRNMVAVGLLVALATQNLDAARAFLTPEARARTSASELKKLSDQVRNGPEREMGTYIKMFDKLVIACKDGTPRVDLGGVRTESAPRKGEEATAIGALKTIGNSQTLFREGDLERDGVLDYADGLNELGAANLIDKVLATGKKNGYRFLVCHSSKTPEFLWMAVANPIDAKKGLRCFAVNQAGVIYHRDTPFELDPDKCEIKGGKPMGR